jgi:hypothetical protein
MTVFQIKAPSSQEGALQAIAYTASSVAASNKFDGHVHQVRLTSTTDCNYQIGDGAQTASQTTSPFLPAKTDRIVTAQAGQNIAAIEATGSSSGTLWVQDLSSHSPSPTHRV